MASDYIRDLPGAQAPMFRASAPRPVPTEQTEEELVKIGRELRARCLEEERKALAGKTESAAETAPANEPVTPPRVAQQPSSHQDVSTAKFKPAPPTLSYEQRSALRAVWRDACDWLQLHHLCRNARCRKAEACRGEPMNCMRAAIPLVPESARQFVRSMIEGKALDLDFEEAFEDAEELQDGWAAWIAGLQAAAKARKPSKKAAK